MKSAYKNELADAAGVSHTTFYRWLSSKREDLASFGVKPTAKMLPPRAVEWICREYGIDYWHWTDWTDWTDWTAVSEHTTHMVLIYNIFI